jgi:hypothetical protein
MIDYLEELLLALRPAFSRQAAFGWFIIAVVGFVMRTDTYGVSSIIRALCLAPLCYPCLLHFFHSSAWDIPTLLYHWWLWLIRQGVAYIVNDRIIFTGDHTKNVKDGRKIPEVETLHQDSETGSKPSYFRGHHWGFIGLLTNAGKKFWSTPMWAEIHRDELEEKRSTRIVTTAIAISHAINRNAYLILDAFFAVGPVFLTARSAAGACMHILTRAKKNVVAYLPAPPKEKGKRGPDPIYGEKLKLMSLFDSCVFPFSTMPSQVYNTVETVKYLVLDLLWKPAKTTIRFVLVESSHGRIIIMSSDLKLSAQSALFLYCRRASIETLFNSLKNLLGGLCYHFWSKYLQPSSRRPAKKNAPRPVSSRPQKTKNTLAAIEKFVVLQIIVLGLLQLLALKFSREIIQTAHSWLRTPPGNVPSEFITKIALENAIRNNLVAFVKNSITQVILKKRVNSAEYYNINKAA